MGSVMSIARSGMNAAVSMLDAAANNITNQQTPGYKRQFVLQEAQPEGGVSTTLAQADLAGADMAGDLVSQLVASLAFKANLRTIQTQDAMLGSLLDVRA